MCFGTTGICLGTSVWDLYVICTKTVVCSSICCFISWQSELKKMCSTRKYPIHLLPRYNLLTHPYILLPAFNFNGQSLKLPDECGPTISDHTKQHCRNKRSMITPEAWTHVIINSQCSSSIKWIERSTKYVLPKIRVSIIYLYIYH